MNEKQDHEGMIRLWGLLALLCSSPVFIVFIHLGDPDRGVGAWLCACYVLFAIRVHWDLRKRVWFWITITMLAFLQVPFVLLAPWSSDRNQEGFAILLVLVLDNGLVYGVIKLVEVATKSRGALADPGAQDS